MTRDIFCEYPSEYFPLQQSRAAMAADTEIISDFYAVIICRHPREWLLCFFALLFPIFFFRLERGRLGWRQPFVRDKCTFSYRFATYAIPPESQAPLFLLLWLPDQKGRKKWKWLASFIELAVMHVDYQFTDESGIWQEDHYLDLNE
jgi:hypothetical protein